jgi:hypothetical protein
VVPAVILALNIVPVNLIAAFLTIQLVLEHVSISVVDDAAVTVVV